MRILLVGGTSFVGRHMAEVAIARGHRITLFHRGQTGVDLFPSSEHVLGDRDADLGRLAGRSWDAAIDVCAYVPRHVREAAAVLRGAVGRYCLISTVSAFERGRAASLDESSPLLGAAQLEDPATETVDAETYGPLKGLCEAEAYAGFERPVLVVRPTYVVGPHDPTDRLAYWVRRAASGGEILAPAPKEAPIQLIDARDLATFTIGLLEAEASGSYCAVGPREPLSWADMLDACLSTAGTPGWVTWVDPEFLRDQGVEIETALPLWLPTEAYPLMRCDPAKSHAAGLRCRPLEATLSDACGWDVERGSPRLAGRLTSARERALLDAWHARQS